MTHLSLHCVRTDRALHGAWQHHGADEPELALQVLAAFERLLHHDETRAALMAEASVLDDVAAAVGHENEAVRAAAQACVALVMEVDRQQQAEGNDTDLGERLCRLGFEAHNRAWLEVVVAAEVPAA